MDRALIPQCSSPDVISVGFMMGLFLLAVRIEHLYEDIVIHRGHIDKLEADIVDRWIVWVKFTPASPRRKNDKAFCRDLVQLIDAKVHIQINR